MTAALALAVASALCFGCALVTGRVGLRTLDARAGAAISIPTATVLLILLAPFTIDLEAFNARAVALFVCVGLFFPAVVTILTFRSNERLGPTVTGAVSGTAPLFALPAAAWLLQERIPPQAAVACIAVAVGVALLAWKPGAESGRFPGWALLWPLSGALIRGFAQAIAKAGLSLWASPFAAGLIGYVVSSATLVAASRYGRAGKPRLTRANFAWFAITGVLNGTAVVLMYTALGIAPVSLVAPVVAAYPLVTALVSALVLREERVTMQMAAGATITVCAIVFLVGG